MRLDSEVPMLTEFPVRPGTLRRCFLGIGVCLLVLLPFLCRAASPNEITVSAASSLKNAFEEIGKSFEASRKGVKVYFNFASSGDLLRQIEGGAPVDVFASAARREMEQLEKKGLIMPGTRKDFALNSLVLVEPASSGMKLTSFADLKRREVKRLAIGNPATVPAGMYADQVLTHLGIAGEIKSKLVFGENVRQVLDYAARGEVDAAIVFSTDAIVRAKDVRVVMRAPDTSHEPVLYPVAVVRGIRNGLLARAFSDYVVSSEGIRILEKYGFKPVSGVRDK